jgi:hypothetical protein
VTQENFERAIAATKIGFAVFPWRTIIRDGKEAKTPLTPNGHLAATTNPEQIATWYLSEFTGAEVQVGVHAGASGVVVADRDRKSGKDGFESSEGWLEFPDTWQQPTPNGDGRHYVYLAPEGVHLAPSADYNGFEGVDVRAGSSWFGLYADPPASREAFAPAPEWLCEPAKSHVGSAFEGGLDDWLNSLPDSDEQPDDRVLDAITRIPDYDFGHTEMVEKGWEMVRLGSEGRMGVRHALELLRDEWLRGDYDTPDNRYSFDKAVDGAIKKAGALDERIAAFPALLSLLDAAPREVVDLATTSDPSKPKPEAHWFRLVKTALRNGFEPEDALALVWQAATTKALSRSWGIEFCSDRVDDVAAEVESERREAAKVEERQAAGLDAVESKPGNSITLLTNGERQYLAQRPNFVHRYVDVAEERFAYINEPYHRSCAWTILSLAYGPTGWAVVKGDMLNLNLFQNVTGDSGSGKTSALKMRREFLREFFAPDGGFDFGSEASTEQMHEDLLNRNGDPAFFNSDEAATFYAELTRPGSWQAKLEGRITDWYDGYVGPVKKRGQNQEGGFCFLVTQFFATPERLFESMTTKQFNSGFLARFLWSYGEPANDEEEDVDEMEDSSVAPRGKHPETMELVEELREVSGRLGTRAAYRASERAVLERIRQANMDMRSTLQERTDWEIAGQSYRRMKDVLRKCTALLAASRGSTRIEMVDVYGALEQMETWVDGLIYAISQVSASAFEREAREIAEYVRRAANPWISEQRLSNRFSRYNNKEWTDRIDWCIRQGYLVFDAKNREHGNRYGYRGEGEGDD